jgi:hypothetical protein
MLQPLDYFGFAGNSLETVSVNYDLDELTDHPLVADGTVDLDRIGYVKIVDAVGDGSTTDSLGNPVYDPYPTAFSSGGFDLDAVEAFVTTDPTLITLAGFTAEPSSGAVTLKWQTESEIDNSGFNLYRAESKSGTYTKINVTLIPAEGSPSEGASYSFVDSDVKNRRAYYYMLEDVDSSGATTRHGPVRALPLWLYELADR